MPVEQLTEYLQTRREMEHDPRWPRVARFVRGGFWRNFKVKYPETNEMYCRMMMVSKRLEELSNDPAANREVLEHARTALYRGQCNCSYWHGAFGGVYLPHLRNGVYQQLIAADTLLDQVAGRHKGWVEATADDYNFDGRQEVMLARRSRRGANRPQSRRAALRVGCARYRTQSAGHAYPPARSVSSHRACR